MLYLVIDYVSVIPAVIVAAAAVATITNHGNLVLCTSAHESKCLL